MTDSLQIRGKDDAQTIKLSGEASNANVEKEVLEKALTEKDAMIESLQRDLENQRQVSSCLTADLSREQWKSQMWYSSARNTYDIVKAECDEEITEVQQEAKRIKLNAEEEAQAVKSKAEKEIALANAHAEASKQVADKRADGVCNVMDSNFDLLSMLAAIEPLLEGMKREAVHARVIKGALEEHERLSGMDYEMREKWKKVKG